MVQELSLDGTFISESFADEACEGPTEVVLSTEALSKLVLRRQTTETAQKTALEIV